MYFDDVARKAKVYKALRNWIRYRKWAEKKYTLYCMIHDICVYCNEPLDTKQFCEICEPELHDLYYMKERNFGLKKETILILKKAITPLH